MAGCCTAGLLSDPAFVKGLSTSWRVAVLLAITCLSVFFFFGPPYLNDLSASAPHTIQDLLRFGGRCWPGPEVLGDSYRMFPRNEAAHARKQEWQQALQDVLLVINYNHPTHQSRAFLKALYGRIFRHVIFVSEKGEPALDIFEVKNISGGFLSYRALPRLFETHPWAKGILWTNDDVALNYWRLAGLSPDKIWAPKFLSLGKFAYSNAEGEDWAGRAMHKARVQAALNRVIPEQIQKFHQTVPFGEYRKAASDVFYFPAKLKKELAALVNIFVEEGVWSEIAVPNMMMCLAEQSEAEIINVVYLWGDAARQQVQTVYNLEMTGIHPWKPISTTNKVEIAKAMAKGDPTIIEDGLVPIWSL